MYVSLLFGQDEEREERSSCNAVRTSLRGMLLLIAMLFVSSIFASPVLPSLDIGQNATFLGVFNVTDLGNDYQCYEPQLKADRRAKYIDCIRAAGFLPNLHQEATFYRGSNRDDPYAMPYTEIAGTCRVTIDLKFGRSDRSTWAVVYMALRKILEACQFKVGGERTGGQTTAGTDSMITITAENVKWPSPNVASAKRLGR